MYASETAVDIIKCLTSHYHTVEEIPFDTLPETHHDVILVQWQKTSIPVYSIDLFFEFLVESTPACVMWMQEYSKLDPKEQSRVLKPNPEDDQQQQNGEPMDLSTIKSVSDYLQ